MRRFWIILLAVAMGLVIALPAATAGRPDKPGKPDKSPTLFDVEFVFSGAEAGFDSTTGCMTDEQEAIVESITMEAGPDNQLRSQEDVPPLLNVNLPVIDSYRYYPYYGDTDAVPKDFAPANYPTEVPFVDQFVGCHGAGITVVTRSWDEENPFSVQQRPGLLTLQVGNGTVDFAWNADYYAEMDAAQPRNPKQEEHPKVTWTDWEHFRFAGDALEWSGVWDKTMKSTGIVEGTISVLHPTRSGGFLDDYPVVVEFTMTISPHKQS